MKTLLVAALAGVVGVSVAAVVDPPTPYDNTNYVLMKGRGDSADAGNQSYLKVGNWDDTEAPTSTKKYYVGPNSTFGTPFNDPDVTITDADLTFKGQMLVVAGCFWHLCSPAKSYTVPDLHLLPGAYFNYTGIKQSLLGKLTLHGTSAKPNEIRYSLKSDLAQAFGMKIVGLPTALFNLRYPNDTSSGWFKLEGDLSEFMGTIRVNRHTKDGAGPYRDGLILTGAELGGAVELAEGTQLKIDRTGDFAAARIETLGTHATMTFANSGMNTVGDLVLKAGTTLNLGYTAATTSLTSALRVTNSLSLEGPIFIQMTGYAGSEQDIPVIHFGPDVDVSGLDLAAFTLTGADSVVEGATRFYLRDEAGGGHTLCVLAMPVVTRTSVTRVSTDRSELCFATATVDGTDYFWSDQKYPGEDASCSNTVYRSTCHMNLPNVRGVYEFPGRRLIVEGSKQIMYAAGNCPGFRCDDFVWKGVTIWTYNMGKEDPTLDDELGTRYSVYRIQGALSVADGFSNDVSTYGPNRMVRIESDVTGGGSLVFRTLDYAALLSNNSGFFELSALNTNFTGTITATTKSNARTDKTDKTPVPNMNQYVRLFVTDGRNLGGARSDYAYNAFHLDQYSQLYVRNDVTLEGNVNRGVSIGNVGRFYTPAGTTLAIRRPLTLKGRLVKEGTGTLALGGELRFGGSDQSATPTAGDNVCEVLAGQVCPLTSHACDGLAFVFHEGTSLSLDGTTTDEDLRTYGLCNVKETTAPFGRADGVEAVCVEVAYGATPPAFQWEQPLVTVASDCANDVKLVLANRMPFNNIVGEIKIRDNNDGTSTFVAAYRKVGCVVIFR